MSTATRSRGRKEGRKAYERDHRKTQRRRLRRNGARDLFGAAHRAGDPHHSVSTVQHPFGIDEGDAAGRRLSFRLEIFLRLFALLATLDAAAAETVLRPHHGLGTA